MTRKAHGQIRLGQVIATYGPGALIDLPRHSAIVGGLDTWPKPGDLEEIHEPRLMCKLQRMTGVDPAPRLYAPPAAANDPRETAKGIGAWRFPEWFVVQEGGGSEERERSRRLVHRKALDERSRFDGRPVVATRFVRACPRGHVDDLDWRAFAHGPEDTCRRPLWLDERGTSVWDDLQIVDDAAGLAFLKKKPKLSERLAAYSDDEVLAAIREAKGGKTEERPVKQVELDALLAAPEGFGDDVPVDPDFHARRLPEHAWRHPHSRQSEGIAAVIQLHRLREVLALVGFTRFEAVTPDIDGEYETDVERAQIALDPQWFPAVENRGEGVFVQLRTATVASWLARPAVKERIDALANGHQHWMKDRKPQRPFPGGPYVLLHTLSHLLIQSLAMRCGYPASSIRERIYADTAAGRWWCRYSGLPVRRSSRPWDEWAWLPGGPGMRLLWYCGGPAASLDRN